jgi:hypothetical protein
MVKWVAIFLIALFAAGGCVVTTTETTTRTIGLEASNAVPGPATSR